jgi:tetratricopeptide (TPR) repeat protein
MKPNLLFLLLGLLWSIPSFGQSREYLNKRLADVNRLPDGQDKITALVDVAYIYQGIDPDSGQFYIYKVLDLSKKLNDGWGKASYYYWMAALYSKKGRYKEANAWIDTGLVYSQEIKSNTMIAGGYQTRALNLASADEVPEALASIDKAWEYAQKTSKGQTKTKILLDRGRILQMTGSVQESIPEYVEAIRLADSLNRPDLQLSAYANIRYSTTAKNSNNTPTKPWAWPIRSA